MPTTVPRDEYPLAPQFSERDAEVLRFLGEEDLLGFTFEGLRRRLGTHSETLSRSLHRLEEKMILEKTPDGYHVTSEGRSAMGVGLLSSSTRPHAPAHRVAILRTLLPFGNASREATSGLKGRWFGPLRWLGYSEDERGTTMKWVTEDGAVQIDAVFSDGELVIEGNVKEGKDLADAIRASYQLVGHLSRFSLEGPEGRVAFYSLHN
ncbi:MAG: hypothetical protein JRN58_00655 [Nitrososphaerota archaeon]|nr:hypothetical protein [Nitrososphaerota archaeon]MDG6966139.1 hypothetical protein [Nitrososphaerota archaeon]MDG6968466.1 hypothetical protein [Nitrososphaerota archaeon]MDG6977574.1 hypothetical protein [Nitrososphaerota archaeon]